MGNQDLGLDGYTEQFVLQFVALCERVGEEPPDLSTDDLCRIPFELLCFGTFNALLVVRGRRELAEDERVLFATTLLNRIVEIARPLGGNVHERVREYWTCTDWGQLLTCFSMHAGLALLGGWGRGYPTASLYSASNAPTFPKLAKIAVDAAFCGPA
jgi:hypothetical protein